MTEEPDWAQKAEEVMRSFDYVLRSHYTITEALRHSYDLGKRHATEWRPIVDAPRDGRTIIVEGGTAYWDGIAWYSDQSQAEIQWDVKVWMPLPPPPEAT